MEKNSRSLADALYSQIEEAYGKVMYTYTTQIIHAERLSKRRNILKWIQLALSALSTGGIIATVITNEQLLAWMGAVCSTALLILTAYFKDADMSSLHLKHLLTSNSLWLIREQYLSLLVDFERLSIEEIVTKRDELQNTLKEIYDSAPITDKKSYTLAQCALQHNESQYFSRKELNLMLPEVLRKEK